METRSEFRHGPCRGPYGAIRSLIRNVGVPALGALLDVAIPVAKCAAQFGVDRELKRVLRALRPATAAGRTGGTWKKSAHGPDPHKNLNRNEPAPGSHLYFPKRDSSAIHGTHGSSSASGSANSESSESPSNSNWSMRRRLPCHALSQGMVRTQSEPLPLRCVKIRVQMDQWACADLGRPGRQRQRHWYRRCAHRGN